MFIHTVFFWFKPNTPGPERQRLVQACHDLLGKIPTVRHLWSGVAAMTPRSVVDNSYDVGLTVVFDDADGHQIYQEHALHKDFIEAHSAHWQRVQVYDFR